MPFDLQSAKPVSGGFDLSSAKPVGAAKLPPETGIRDQLTSGVNEGVADTLGLPVDTVANVMDLVKAGAGTAYGAATGKTPPAVLDPMNREAAIGSSDWIKKQMKDARMVSGIAPQTTGQKVARFGGELGGAAIGPGGPARAEKAGALAAREIAEEAPAVTATARDAMQARKAGYVLPPTQSNPTVGNKVLEGVSGKLQTRQEASIRNQEVTNDLASKSIGLKKGTVLSEDELKNVREEAGKAYEAVRNVKTPITVNKRYKDGVNQLGSEWASVEERFPELVNSKDIETLRTSLNRVEGATPSQAVDLIRFLRSSANVNFKHADKPEKLALAQAQREGAQLVEQALDAHLKGAGKASLYEDFVKARQTIARTYDIEAALNQSGNVSAAKLAQLGRKKSFSGELEQIASFGASYPHAAQLPERVGGTPITMTDVALGVMGDIATGNFLGMSAAATRPAIRKMLLSNWYQDRFVAKAPQ